MDTSNMYVKFLPFASDNEVKAITERTIKFSTVNEFNDFNERVTVGGPVNDDVSRFVEELKEQLDSDCEKKSLLISKLKEELYLNISGCANIEETNTFIEKTSKIIKEGRYCDIERVRWPSVVEYLGYINTGIFCMSDIKVFDDDSAQLMFAHYSNNLKGVALVYKLKGKKKAEEVKYRECRGVNTFSDNILLKEYLQGKHTSLFLNKSESWKYEKEYRLFSSPGIHLASDNGLELIGVFYTKRMNNPCVLKLVKEAKQQKLFFEMIEPSYESIKPRKFKVYTSEGKKSVKDYLEEYLEKDEQ